VEVNVSVMTDIVTDIATDTAARRCYADAETGGGGDARGNE
jgi:hypothetical protein